MNLLTVMTAQMQRHSSTRPRPVGVTVWVSSCDSSALDTRIFDIPVRNFVWLPRAVVKILLLQNAKYALYTILISKTTYDICNFRETVWRKSYMKSMQIAFIC